MPTTILTNPFESEAVLLTIKAAILLLLIFYALFSLIVIRQVDLMSKTLITNISPYLKLITITNFIFAIVLIVFAWRVL